MPIYEYRCEACGHQEDHLQKLSEPALTKCPACGKKKYRKQLTAAGFQLKGSGWYATDFKGGKTEAKTEAKTDAKAETKSESKADAKSETKTETKSDTKPVKKTPASTTN